MSTSVRPSDRRGPSPTASWLSERLGLQGLAYAVPEHANSLPYLLGGITFTGFIILIVSGVYLAQFYHPHPSDARQSMVYLITGVPLGDLARSIHFWTAQIVSVTILLHMLRVLFTGAYKRPREINWYVGLELLAVTLGLVFTGTVTETSTQASASPAMVQEPTSELHMLDRTKPAGQIVGASLVALASLVLGVLLVRKPG